MRPVDNKGKDGEKNCFSLRCCCMAKKPVRDQRGSNHKQHRGDGEGSPAMWIVLKHKSCAPTTAIGTNLYLTSIRLLGLCPSLSSRRTIGPIPSKLQLFQANQAKYCKQGGGRVKLQPSQGLRSEICKPARESDRNSSGKLLGSIG